MQRGRGGEEATSRCEINNVALRRYETLLCRCAGSRRNIEEHYDAGNAMYSLFLDESMMYSSGVHHDGESLYQAQMNKLDAVIEQVGGGGREAGGRGGSRKPLGGGVGSKQIGDSHGGRSTPINSQQLFPLHSAVIRAFEPIWQLYPIYPPSCPAHRQISGPQTMCWRSAAAGGALPFERHRCVCVCGGGGALW